MGFNKRKLIAVVMVLVMFLPIMHINAAEAKAKGIAGSVTASELYMREGPGTGYSRITVNGEGVVLRKGQSVRILKEEDGWYLINVDLDGSTLSGYSSKQFIFASGEIPVEAEPVVVVEGVITANELFMREGPGTSFANVYVGKEKVLLVKNQSVVILEERDGWYKIETEYKGNKVEGYSIGTYVKVLGEKVIDDATPVPTPTGKPDVSPTPTVGSDSSDSSTPTGTVADDFSAPVQYGDHTIAEFIEGEVVLPEEYNLGQKSFSVKYNLHAKARYDAIEVRKTSTTASTVIAKLPMNAEFIVVGMSINSTNIDGKQVDMRWYRIATVVDGEAVRGYCLSSDVEIIDEMKATIKYANQVIRSKTSGSSKAVTTSKGKKIKLAKGTEIKIVGEVQKKLTKWFKVEVTYKKETVTGYILANRLIPVSNAKKVNLKFPVLKPEYMTTPTPTEEPVISPTDVENPGDTTDIPTSEPVVTPDVELTPTPAQIPDYEFEGGNATIKDAASLSVKEEPKYSSASKFTEDKKVIMLYTGQPVEVISSAYESGISWCNIRFVYNGVEYFGYVNSMYIQPDGVLDIMGNGDGPSAAVVDFETKLAMQGFPESYKKPLRELHEKYPNWEFEAFKTGLDWNETIAAEAEAGINLLPNTKSVEWKSLETGAYSWKTDTFTVFDGSTWVTASKEAIEYYMDPRNFLAEDTIFQFEKLTYNPSYQTKAGINTILKNTAMNNSSYSYTDENGVERSITYTDTFAMAAEYSGVSPLHLASRVKQEVTLGANAMSNSVTGTVSGYEGLYNYYNIGAYNSTVAGGAIANGLNYARNGSSSATLNLKCLFPWNNRLRSILGGAFYIGNNYINRGQDTIYLQKFNVTSNNTYNHQYMGNVEAPYSEGKRLLAAYENPAELAVVFSIPVFENMPENACPVPEKKFNPNNWLSSLKLYDINGEKISLTPTFSITSSGEYNVIVDGNVDYIKIKATPVSSKATVISNNYFYPEVGSNRMVVSVQAENGDVRDYVVNVIREEFVPTPEPTPEITPEPTPDADNDPTPEITPDVDSSPTPELTPEVTPETEPENTPDPTPEASSGDGWYDVP